MFQNLKIVLVIAIAFILSFSILLAALNNVEPQLVSLDFQKKFYFKEFDPEIKKIFLVGSSEVHRLNATYIDNYISKQVENYKVYNISIHSDTPQRRIASLDLIISSDPYMIVYGTGTRDYVLPQPIAKSNSLPKNALPTMPEFFDLTSEIDKVISYDFEKLQSPKIHVLRFIRDTLELRTPEVTEDMLTTNTPFMKYKKTWYTVQTQKELDLFYDRPIWHGIKDPNSDKSVASLKQIISEFKKNDIKTVLFTNPSPRQEQDLIGNHDIEIFEQTLENIANDNSVNVYFLHKQYNDSPIFQGGNHVTLSEAGLIYSEDIAKIILKEIDP